MSTAYDVQEEYIRLIQLAVADPNNERVAKGTQWIYNDLPASTMGPANYPRISVLHISSPSTQHEIGGNYQRLNVRIEVQIRTLKNLKFNNKNSSEYINDVGLQVVDALRSQTAYDGLRTNAGVFQTTLDSENLTVANDIVIKSLIYNNVMRR